MGVCEFVCVCVHLFVCISVYVVCVCVCVECKRAREGESVRAYRKSVLKIRNINVNGCVNSSLLQSVLPV